LSLKYSNRHSPRKEPLRLKTFSKPLSRRVQTVGGRKIPADFYISYYCGTFIEAVKWWFQNGLSVSPEELTSYFEAVIGKSA